MSRTGRTALALVAGAALLASCSGSGASTGPVLATVKEWQIDLSARILKAGPITFKINNAGDKEHEFVVRKTDLQPDKLPLNADGTIKEDAAELSTAGEPSEVANILSGSSDKTLTLTLKPGHYVVFCNLHVTDLLHYQKGMHVDFTVQ